MSAPTLENRPYDEIRVGDTAALTRTLTRGDIKTFAALSGDMNPAHVDDAYAREHGPGRLTAHGMWCGALISSLLGNELPGPGSVLMSQQLRFLRPIMADETITASVTVREKRADGRLVVMDCRCTAESGETLATGTAEVMAPAEKLVVSLAHLPALAAGTRDKFQRLVEHVGALPALPAAVVHPCSDTALQAAIDAAEAGMIVPILVGPASKIHAVAERIGADISGCWLVNAPHSHAAAEKAVELVRSGEAELLIKGSLHTDELLSEVVRRDTGLRTERRLSHAFVMDVPTYHKALVVTDAAINIYPTMDEKRDICQNAIDLCHALGIRRPKLAILSAVETINARIPSTTDAAGLCKMADRGQITGAVLDGPLAMDNAISREAADIKGIRSHVAGDADILLAPDLEAGNILAKQLTFMAHADAAGVVLGARVPIVLTSRADSVRVRMASCAVAVLAASARHSAGKIDT